jgi:bifunctional DNA-binding transcriptional regulator/antitoxin component of YhaV-PrlF toxin-antitoxin module
METLQFKLPVGAKRQVTIPKRCMELLSLEEGGELMLEIKGGLAILHPMVSIPRGELPEELRVKFEARRGVKRSDIPLDQFLKEIGYVAKDKRKTATVSAKAPIIQQKTKLAKSISKKPKMVQVAAQKAYAMKTR